MKTIISGKKEACQKAADEIARLVRDKPDACIAFSAAEIPDELFEELRVLYLAGKADFSKLRVFTAAEYVPGNMLGALLREKMHSRVNISRENCFFMNEDTYSKYDKTIASFGGLDMAVLGLGDNCQIGFNEAGTPFSSLTHIQKLTDSFRRQFASLFGDQEKIPEKGMTLGIRSITNADKIIVLAFGEGKADALHRMYYARNDIATPAAFLQIPSDVSVYTDPAAAINL